MELSVTEVEGGLLLTAGGQRLRFQPDNRGRLVFTTEILTPDSWKPVATISNTFVQGASFDLAPSGYVVESSTKDGIRVRFRGEKPFPWEGRVSADRADPWFDFHVQADLPGPVELKSEPILEPWCVIWLSEVDLLRFTQEDTWRQTAIEAPTRSSTGLPGNDLPAAYFYDYAHRAELCFYADLEVMDWMSYDNLARFQDLRIGSVRTSGPRPRYGFGMHAHRRAGNRFPAGRQSFAFKLLQRYRATAPTQWQALDTLIEACAPLLKPGTSAPTIWAETSARTLVDLRQTDRTMTEVDGVLGHTAYVRTGPGSAEAIELMTQADVLAPLSLLGEIDAEYREHADRLAASLPHFVRPATGVFGNRLPAPGGPEIVDSWYFFENALIKTAWIARARGDAGLQKQVTASLQQARRLAQMCGYLFPLFYNADTLETTGRGTNLAVNGLYAYACLLEHERTGDKQWLMEAERALRTLMAAPLELLYHEAQELGFAALAAALLPERGCDQAWLGKARSIVNAQLRMAYWYSDPTKLQAGYDVRGGFQACAGLLYPAFKENVESILPWTGLLPRLGLDPLLLTFMDLQRRHNRYFFEEKGSAIPFEDLGTLELGPGVGRLGKEIYGAGEVFWMALCFDRLARAEDPEVLVVWLDALESWNHFPPASLRLVVFNPTPVERTTRIRPQLAGAPVEVKLAPREARLLEIRS
jgi:hypothetical protein